MSWTHGKQFLRLGVNIPNLSRRAYDDQTNRQGTYQFASLSAYQASTPYAYLIQQGTGRGTYWYNEIGGFIQDQISLKPNLQVSLGLRYDWQTYLDDYNNLAPRVSVAWSPGTQSSTVIRTGAGVFYDRTGGDTLANIKLHNGVLLRQYQVTNPSYPNPLPPGQTFSGFPTNYVQFAPNIHTPYSIQYSAGVERKVGKSVTFTAGYRGAVGIDLFRSRDANAPLGPLYAARPNLNVGVLQLVEPEGRQLTNALDLGFQGRVGRWFSGQAQYSLGRTENNTGGIYFFPQDQYNPSAEWGRADFDRLSRFNLLGNINPDHWLTLGVGLTLYSGTPYTETAGTDRYNTGLGNARPAGVGRNTLRAGGTVSLDLRWAHDFHLNAEKAEKAKIVTVGFDGFNVLNHPNYTGYIGSVNSPLFQQPTSALPGRQLQAGIRFKF